MKFGIYGKTRGTACPPSSIAATKAPPERRRQAISLPHSLKAFFASCDEWRISSLQSDGTGPPRVLRLDSRGLVAGHLEEHLHLDFRNCERNFHRVGFCIHGQVLEQLAKLGVAGGIHLRHTHEELQHIRQGSCILVIACGQFAADFDHASEFDATARLLNAFYEIALQSAAHIFIRDHVRK